MKDDFDTTYRRLASLVALHGWARGLLRGAAMASALVAAGAIGGFFGSTLVSAGSGGLVAASHSIGATARDGVSISAIPGKFEKIGRTLDVFSAGLGENLEIIGRLTHYILEQSWREFQRVWRSVPPPKDPLPNLEATTRQQVQNRNNTSTAKS